MTITTITRTSALGIVGAVLASSACSAEGPSGNESATGVGERDSVSTSEEPAVEELLADADNDKYVVARVEIERGHNLTFYEAEPGGLFMREEMLQSHQSVLGKSGEADALDVFRALQPEVDVPHALLQAYERAETVATADVGLEASELLDAVGGGAPAGASPAIAAHAEGHGDGIGTVGQAHSTSSASHFVATHGGCNWGPRLSFCRVNWANGFWASATPANSATCIVDHYAGNGITAKLTAGGTALSFYQAPATIVTHSWGIASGNITRRIDIQNASGDSFHVGCRWY